VIGTQMSGAGNIGEPHLAWIFSGFYPSGRLDARTLSVSTFAAATGSVERRTQSAFSSARSYGAFILFP
jgi:hypothetical protein